MFEFLRKLQSQGDKISRVNTIRYQIYQLTLIFYGVAVGCHKGRFTVHSQGCLHLQASVCLGFNKRAAEFYE